MASLVVIVVKGTIDIGGFSVVWERARDAERVEFFKYVTATNKKLIYITNSLSYHAFLKCTSFDPDPRTRHTFWTSIVGMFFVWLPLYAATQANIQRFAAMPNIQTVRR